MPARKGFFAAGMMLFLVMRRFGRAFDPLFMRGGIAISEPNGL